MAGGDRSVIGSWWTTTTTTTTTTALVTDVASLIDDGVDGGKAFAIVECRRGKVYVVSFMLCDVVFCP